MSMPHEANSSVCGASAAVGVPVIGAVTLTSMIMLDSVWSLLFTSSVCSINMLLATQAPASGKRDYCNESTMLRRTMQNYFVTSGVVVVVGKMCHKKFQCVVFGRAYYRTATMNMMTIQTLIEFHKKIYMYT